jgi:hypothetical protein
MVQRFSSCFKAKTQQPSGFSLNRDPRRQVFVCGMAVKATLYSAQDAVYKLENRSNCCLRLQEGLPPAGLR